MKELNKKNVLVLPKSVSCPGSATEKTTDCQLYVVKVFFCHPYHFILLLLELVNRLLISFSSQYINLH